MFWETLDFYISDMYWKTDEKVLIIHERLTSESLALISGEERGRTAIERNMNWITVGCLHNHKANKHVLIRKLYI